jgi:hypothetical protein
MITMIILDSTKLNPCRSRQAHPSTQVARVAPRGTGTTAFFPLHPGRISSTPLNIAMTTVQTASPHLRVSAAKSSSSESKESPSTRISPPETSAVDDHFFWTYTEEPHRSRRQAIIKAHPEVRCALIQSCTPYVLHEGIDYSYGPWALFLASPVYVPGSLANPGYLPPCLGHQALRT